MKLIKKIFLKFIMIFREVFVYHHKSLDFRAEVFASVIGANPNYGKCEEALLNDVVTKIYPKQPTRIKLLQETVLEYLHNISDGNYSAEDLALNIDRSLKENPKLILKIDVNTLHKFISCNVDDDTKLEQQRLIDFFNDSVAIYTARIKHG